MTQDEIIEMVKQAGGFEVDENDPQCSIGKIAFDLEEIEAFYKLAAAKKREACVKVVDSWGGLCEDAGFLADRIRAREQA